jgi:hypothetical protein
VASGDDPLRHLGSVIRILSALVDAMIIDSYQEWRWLAAVETAIMRESGQREGFTRNQAEQVMTRRGWKTVEDAYGQALIPKNHWPVVDRRLFGSFTDAEIARNTGHPIRTVQLWLHDDLLKLKNLDFGDLD